MVIRIRRQFVPVLIPNAGLRRVQEEENRRMPSVDHSVSDTYYQSSNESCWYAAYCMLFDWKGKPTSAIRERIEKAGLDYADFWKKGLPVEKYNDVRWCLGLSGFRRAYFGQLVDDLDYFGKVLKDYGPFWCAFSVPGEHIVVVHGVDVDKEQIKVMNPWSDGGSSAQKQKYSPGEFKRRLGSKDLRAAAQMWVA